MMKHRKIAIIALIAVWIVTAIVALKSTSKLTYLEYQYENENSDSYVVLKRKNQYIEQKFTSPYDLLHGVSIKIDTFSRDNNSIWNVALVDGKTGNVLYKKDYNASLIQDNSFHLFKFDKNIKVKKGANYLIKVTAKKVYKNTRIAFYVGSKSALSSVIKNGTKLSESLCFSVYGGDFDIWWVAYPIMISAAISFLIIRAAIVSSKGKKILNDKIVGSILVALAVLLLLNSFSVTGNFTDEFDNIRGGMVIAKGGVLYKDYVTQHTPVMYYLCGIFAFLGAGSLEQFRLSYFLFEAILWGLLYARHVNFFGKKKMLSLAALECVFVTSVLGVKQGYMILSDGMQGLCMVALLLEFLRYYKDKKIGWDRAIVISLCIWGSFGSAFISAYAILFVVIAVVGLEIFWHLNTENKISELIKRYYKLVVCVIVPLVAAAIYFKVNHALKIAFEQFYLFNREVYSQYYSIGDNLFKPFITSIQNFFGIFSDKINAMIASTATNADILQFIIITLATTVIVTMCRKKRYIEGLTLFAVMIFSATRGYDFHGIAAWYVAIMIIALYGDDIFNALTRKIAIPLSVIICIFLVSLYANSLCTNLLYEQQPISDIESKVVALTNKNDKILIDAYCCDSIYFCYKDRYPANRACYMLAWYMDWYERDTIDDLNNKKPKVVVYYPEQEVWGYKYYTNDFYNKLKKNYKQVSQNPNDGWKYRVWIRNKK